MALKKINTQSLELQLIQDNVDAALIPIQASPFVGGVLIANQSILSGQDNLIRHQLGRVPQFVAIGIPNVDTRIWSPASTQLSNQSSNTTFLNLRCSTSCTVSVWAD